MRRAMTVLVFLALGAIFTVGVAWLCAAFVETGPATSESITQRTLPDLTKETIAVHPGFGHSRVTTVQGNLTIEDGGFYFSDDDAAARRGRGIGPRPPHREEALAGWPLRALSCENRTNVTLRTETGWMTMGGGAVRTDEVIGGIQLPTAAPIGWRALPYTPLWIGLILDVLFYAGALWLLFVTPGRLRRRARLRRGQCIHCAYDLRGHDHVACPECGLQTSRSQE